MDDHSSNVLVDKSPTMNSLVKIEVPGTPESNVSWDDNAHCKKEVKNQEDPEQLLTKYLHDTNVYYEGPDKATAKTEGNHQGSTPQQPARVFKCGVGSYFGNFADSGTYQTIKGIWAPSYEDGLEMPELCLGFEYRSKSADGVDGDGEPVSGSYTGWFDDDGDEKIEENDLTIRFKKNSGGYYNLEGSCCNKYGRHVLTGVRKRDGDGTCIIFKHTVEFYSQVARV